MDEQAIKNRVENLLLLTGQGSVGGLTALASELLTGTLGVMTAVYGPDSPQARTLIGVAEEVRKKSPSPSQLEYNSQSIIRAAQGSLKNLQAELHGGLVGSLQKRFTGEILTDLVQLGLLLV